ncbi:ABC transporter ATP-binding protein [Stetteria hydrogenophila]
MECPGGVRLRGVEAGYPGFTLGPVDLEAGQGEVLVLVGPNASGKTTLLRVLAGILAIRAGEAEACGYKARAGGRLPGERLAAYAPAAPQLDPWARVSEVLEAAGVREAPPWLSGILDRRVGELSSGQRRLVDLARALGQRRPLLLVDEPLAFLDVKHQALIAGELVAHARRGGVAVVAVHELHLVPFIADRVAVVRDGRVIASGPPGEALDQRLLEEAYGARLQAVETPWGRILLPLIPPVYGERGA